MLTQMILVLLEVFRDTKKKNSFSNVIHTIHFRKIFFYKVERKNEIVFLRLLKKLFKLELGCKKTCFTQNLSYLNPKGEDSSCKIEVPIYGYLYIKISRKNLVQIIGYYRNFHGYYK